MSPRRANPATKEQLLEAAEQLLLTKGFAATTVDDICAAASLTKGAFFHYFANKDELGQAVLERWVREGGQAFQQAPFLQQTDPLARVVGYIDFTIARSLDPVRQTGCLIGMFSQELAQTHPALRMFCAQSFDGWAQGFQQLLDDAKAKYAPDAAFDTRSLAYHLIAIFEGSLILAKAQQDRQVIADNLQHFRTYLYALFQNHAHTGEKEPEKPERRWHNANIPKSRHGKRSA